MEGSLGVIYSNILLHEIFWHGVLGNTLDKGNDGTLSSTSTPYLSLLDLSPFSNQINTKFNTK
jgi:hypothetical protein